MTKVAPIVNEQLFAPAPQFTLAPTPLRFIGKMPVFEDEHGEFVLIYTKLFHPRTKTTEELQVKCDANIDAIRNVYELVLRNSSEIDPKVKRSEGTLGYIVHKRGNNLTTAGDTSLPRTLFGKTYHYARHTRDDDRDLRKGAFLPKEKK